MRLGVCVCGGGVGPVLAAALLRTALHDCAAAAKCWHPCALAVAAAACHSSLMYVPACPAPWRPCRPAIWTLRCRTVLLTMSTCGERQPDCLESAAEVSEAGRALSGCSTTCVPHCAPPSCRVVAESLSGVLQAFRPDLGAPPACPPAGCLAPACLLLLARACRSLVSELHTSLHQFPSHTTHTITPAYAVLYDAGVDPHADDALGRLALSDAGLWRRELLVRPGPAAAPLNAP